MINHVPDFEINDKDRRRDVAGISIKKVYSFSSSPLEIKQVVKFDIKRIAYICRSRERINRDRDTIETCYTRELARELRHVCV